MFKWLRTFRQLKSFAQRGIPVFMTENDELCLKRERGKNSDPVIIVSVPKSGTYLFAEILSAVGVQDVNVHVATYGFQDLRYCSKDFAVAHSAEIFQMVPSEELLPMILPGQFVVSHLPCRPEILRQLKRFKVIFTYRGLRDTLVSTMRWVAKKGELAGSPEGWESLPDCPAKMEQFLEKDGEHFLQIIRSVRDWAAQPGVLSLSFEEIQGDYGAWRQTQAVQRIVDLLGISFPPAEFNQVLKKCLGKDTVTFSGKRSNCNDVWSDKVEDYVVKHGGDELEAFWKTNVEEYQERRQAG